MELVFAVAKVVDMCELVGGRIQMIWKTTIGMIDGQGKSLLLLDPEW